MADIATLVVLHELIESNDKKPQKKIDEKEKREGILQQHHKRVKIADRGGFREMFRMDVTDFEFILGQISDLLSPQERLVETNPIECDERLALTLRYLATGESFQYLSFQYRISFNAVSYIVTGCYKAIVEQMASDFVKVPSKKAEWRSISRKFEERWNFPYALGAVHGKHIRIQKPKNGAFYYNYKHTCSIILVVITGPEYEYLCADVGSNEGVNDSGIWNKSSLLQGYKRDKLIFRIRKIV